MEGILKRTEGAGKLTVGGVGIPEGSREKEEVAERTMPGGLNQLSMGMRQREDRQTNEHILSKLHR